MQRVSDLHTCLGYIYIDLAKCVGWNDQKRILEKPLTKKKIVVIVYIWDKKPRVQSLK